MVPGLFGGKPMVLGGDKLTVQLQANGKKALEACIPGVRRYLADRFGRQVSIEIQAHGELEGPDLFRQTEKMRWEMVEQLPKTRPPAASRERPASGPPQERRFGNVRWGIPFLDGPLWTRPFPSGM